MSTKLLSHVLLCSKGYEESSYGETGTLSLGYANLNIIRILRLHWILLVLFLAMPLILSLAYAWKSVSKPFAIQMTWVVFNIISSVSYSILPELYRIIILKFVFFCMSISKGKYPL